MKNDMSQTIIQWDEYTLRLANGTPAGSLFVQICKGGRIPADPGLGPIKPPEPKSPGLIESYQDEIIDQRLQAANANLPHDSQIERTSIPVPNEREVWKYFGERQSAYATSFKNWETAKQLFAVEWPAANRVGYSFVEVNIFPTSLEIIRNTAEGKLANDSQDGFLLRKAAFDTHSHVEASAAALATLAAKKAFESYTQASSVSAEAYIVESERLYAHYVKMKGSDPLDSAERQQQILSGLYESSWSQWIKTRKDTDTMPLDYEGCKLAIRSKETKMILDASQIEVQKASHTTDTKADQAEKKVITKVCEGFDGVKCGKSFTTTNPKHTRCEEHQALSRKAWKSNSRDRKPAAPPVVAEKKPKKKKKPVSSKKAHITFHSDDDKDSDDDREEDDDGDADATHLGGPTHEQCI